MQSSDTAPPDNDLPDLAALERMWPQMRYGDPWRFNWWRYVGRTRRQREGLVARRVDRCPRGLIVLASGAIRTRSRISGEFTAREVQP
jgi:hypothetical protein